MAISIKGMDKLIEKLGKLSKIEAKEIIEDVGSDIEEAIKDKASFSKASRHIGKCDVRDYGNSYFLDVGLKNDKVPFEEWKQLWFHNWGYFNKGLNFDGMDFINNHQLWFDSAVKSVEQEAMQKIKRKVRAEIKAFKK